MSAPSVADATLILAHAQLSAIDSLTIEDFDTDDDVLVITAQYEHDAKVVTDTINLEVDVLDQVSATLNLYSEALDGSIINHPVTKSESAPYFPVEAAKLTEAIDAHLHSLYTRTHASLAERLAECCEEVIDLVDESTIRIGLPDGFWLLGITTEVGLDLIGLDGSRHVLVDALATGHDGTIDTELLFDLVVPVIESTVGILTKARPLLGLVRSDMQVAPTVAVNAPVVSSAIPAVAENAAPWDEAPAPAESATTASPTSLGEGWVSTSDGGYIFVGTDTDMHWN